MFSVLGSLSHPDTLTSYASYFREQYMSMSHSHTSQHWSHLPRCEFIQLAMIKAEEEIRRGGPEEEMIRLAQQGKIETIISQKEPVELQNLFLSPPLVVLPPPQAVRVCLIEGAPGAGKSTLALHICHQWAQGASWLARFDIVFLLYLRDEAVQNAKTLADVLPVELPHSQSIVSQLQASYGKGVLFIFDGWDEFPHNLMKDSLISSIIHQPHKLSLHQSAVLITSRPVSSGNLLNVADRRIEIMGFTQHQIREYIEKCLGNSTLVQKLVQHLEDHPVIEGYCYIPLHVAILVHIFLTMKGALPTTRHELFCSLVLCCIVREHETHEPDKPLPELSSLDDLPDDLKTKLNQLSVLAYNGVMQDKIVFYQKDLLASQLPSSLSSLGLLQAVEGLALYTKSLSYNFLHLSVQELLAAYNISQMDPSEQVRVFTLLFGSSRFQSVLHFYCGFTKLANPEIQAFVSSFQIEKSTLEVLLHLLHCFYEAQQPSLCQLIDPRFIPNEKQTFNSLYLTPVDYLAIGFFITSLLSAPTANTPPIHLVVSNTDDHQLKVLLNELSKCPIGREPSLARSRLDLYVLYITEQGVSYIVSHLKRDSSAISQLKVTDSINVSLEYLLLPIVEAMQTNTFLTNLILPFMHKVHDYSALTKMLQVNVSLTHLDLTTYDFVSQIEHPDSRNPHVISCIFEGLEHNTVLRSLSISGILTTDTNAEHIARALKVNCSLRALNMGRCYFLGSNGIHLILDSLLVNSTLQTLHISYFDMDVWNTFIQKRTTAAKKLPPIDIILLYECRSLSDTRTR